MADVKQLLERIDAAFSDSDKKLKEFRSKEVQKHEGRQQRLQRLEQVFDQLRSAWRPRLEALSQKFGDRVKVNPTVTPGRRQAAFEFQSPLARIGLRLSALTDTDVTKVILNYDLDILPVLMEFERHAEIEFPLEQVDVEALTKWLDDRIVAFVKTYLALHENEYYLQDHMVEDPVAGVRFPKYAAAATLEVEGRTYYFIGEETRAAFEQQEEPAVLVKPR